MIPNIRKILYATDLSKNARYAFGYAASLSAVYGAKIVVLHVVEELTPTAQMIVGDIIGETRWTSLQNEKQSQVFNTIENRLKEFHQQVRCDLSSCEFVIEETLLVAGNPVEQILHHTEKLDVDLVVMGSHGQGMLAEVMIGSTSRRVLRRCRKPVMVIRLPEPSESG